MLVTYVADCYIDKLSLHFIGDELVKLYEV
jgi:hypothetical protein